MVPFKIDQNIVKAFKTINVQDVEKMALIMHREMELVKK